VQILNGWNATVSQSGSTVTAKAPSWAPTLNAGASVSIGFQANGSSSGQPTGYAVDGTVCGVS
jgi:endoglucanase